MISELHSGNLFIAEIKQKKKIMEDTSRVSLIIKALSHQVALL